RNPRQFTVDHVISTEEARRLGWSAEDADSLDNCQGVCRACNREKGDGLSTRPEPKPTWVNPRFAHLI
ncbi:MAG TPA: HNH endonuclease, partial [Aeromicrobium sp.]